MELFPGLLETAERKLARLEPFLDGSGWVEIGFVEEQNPRIAEKYHCEIVAHLKGRRLKVEGSAPEPLAALDLAAQRVDKQVKRLKDKRVKRGRRTHTGNGGGRLDAGAPGIEGPVGDAPGSPAIVEVREADAKPMTPIEAAMQLEVEDQEFLLFLNAESDRAAVIYRRRDGDYGLVEVPG